MTSIIGVNLRRLEVYITTPLGPSHWQKQPPLGAVASVGDYKKLLCMCAYVYVQQARPGVYDLVRGGAVPPFWGKR